MIVPIPGIPMPFIPMPPQRKPETGEKLCERAKRDALIGCYFCPSTATTFVSNEMPRCTSCAERWRRKE
jgi:hypothetical protein